MSDVRDKLADQLPATIGRYQITGSLGHGAMGAVYKAFDPLIRRPLAIKTVRLDIPRSTPQYRAFLDRFHHEAQISGTLSHPGIVTLFDLGEDNGDPFFAMEFVDGRTIADILAEGTRFRPERVVGLISQVAAALDYAHSRGVIHRDIKPANLILYDGDRVKITDFGIAKLADADITHAGALLGTPSYMSPEQAMGEPLDGRSDIFSLGVVAFEMLSGQQPFPGSNVTSILYKLVHVDPIEPADLEMHGLLPQQWHAVFHKVLAKKPDHRYQTACAFVQELEYCLGSWWDGPGGSEETLVVVPGPEVPTVELSRLPSPPAPRVPAPAAAAASALALGPSPELADQAPPPATLLAASEATVLMPPPLEQGQLTLPPPPTVPALPDVARAEPAAVRRRPPRPGIPLPMVLGGAAAGLAAVALVAWALRAWAPASTSTPGASRLEPPAGTGAAAAAAPLPRRASGTLRVTSDPTGARVLVDGRPRGRAPLELGELGFARYEVRVEQAGFEPESRRVALSAEAPEAELRFTLRRRASVPAAGAADFVSTPAGASVSVDGQLVGTTPLRGQALQPGQRHVEIALDGHETWSSTIDVKAGETGLVDVRLRARPPVAPTPEPVDVTRVYANELGQVDTLARRVSGTSPSYPGRAPRLRTGQRVSVLVRFVVSTEGEATEVVVVESAGQAVDDVVVAAVRGWRFEPATKGGLRVKVEMPFRQTFLGG